MVYYNPHNILAAFHPQQIPKTTRGPFGCLFHGSFVDVSPKKNPGSIGFVYPRNLQRSDPRTERTPKKPEYLLARIATYLDRGPLGSWFHPWDWYMGVSENSGFSPQIIHSKIRLFHYKLTIHGWIFGWVLPKDLEGPSLFARLCWCQCSPLKRWSYVVITSYGWKTGEVSERQVPIGTIHGNGIYIYLPIYMEWLLMCMCFFHVGKYTSFMDAMGGFWWIGHWQTCMP